MLLHPGAEISASCPIHEWRFRPIPVVAAFSRAAALEPMVPSKDAIWHWFTDARPDRVKQGGVSRARGASA